MVLFFQVKQYGKPLMDKIEVIMKREQQEEEQKDSHGHGQHSHDKAAEIEG
jgi:FKBP-type peptidyl-prolyl cis-trans isomerase 2